jgi:hypothetical protein
MTATNSAMKMTNATLDSAQMISASAARTASNRNVPVAPVAVHG